MGDMMNKKILILLIIVFFIPTIIATVWFVSKINNPYNPSSVDKVILRNDQGELWECIDKKDKSFFLNLVKNLKPIEKQTFTPDKWTLYRLELVETFDLITFYL